MIRSPLAGLRPFPVPEPARQRRGVAAAIAGLLGPVVSSVPPPGWLRPGQRLPFARLVGAIEEFGGGMLALPVGSGKTFVALGAAAAVRPGAPVSVVAPAVLRSMWERVAADLGLGIRFTSHEAVSRGVAPTGEGAVIVDESHRFRNPRTRRYGCLAPTLAGRPVILTTGTPVVNGLADLGAQLALGIRDDALRFHGIRSIGQALRSPPVSPVFGRIIVAGRPPSGMPGARSRTLDWARDDRHLARIVAGLDRLKLSRVPPVAALLRSTLFHAAASSPAALRLALGRYRRLLTHAAAAGRAGRPINRQLVRDLVAADPDQLLMWEVLAPMTAADDLAMGDVRRTDALIRRTRRWQDGDAKRRQLTRLIADRTPTLVFASSVETVHYLRRNLPGSGIAWLTGSGAGFAGGRASRATVLAAFDPAAAFDARIERPWLLITSDVAAEGLNLQRVGRIVHYDLPWTAVRLAQRAGRAVRLGATFAEIEVWRFLVPDAIEARLALEGAVRRKAGLPGQAGLSGPVLQAVERDVGIAARFRGVEPERGWVRAGPGPAVAGVVVRIGGREAAWVLVRGSDGGWSDDRDAIEAALVSAAGGEECASDATAPAALEAVLDSLAVALMERLAMIEAMALVGNEVPGRARATCATRPAALRAEPFLRFMRRGHTAGEAMLAAAALRGDGAALRRAAALGREESAGPVSVSVAGLILPSGEDRYLVRP